MSTKEEHDDMALPAGRTCGECASWSRCKAFIGSLKPSNTRCDWSPSRFRISLERVAALEAALLWVLWHHQGGSSPVGQPIRRLLGIEQHAHLSNEQLQAAKSFAPQRDRMRTPLSDVEQLALNRALMRSISVIDSPVHVCPVKDIECGTREINWCAACPKRAAR